jgi:hypothetical protein
VDDPVEVIGGLTVTKNPLNKFSNVTYNVILWCVRVRYRLYLHGYPNNLIAFDSNRALLRRFNFAGNSKNTLRSSLHVHNIFARFYPNLSFSRQILIVPNIKFHGNPPSRSRADTRRRTYGHNEVNTHFSRISKRA